MTTRKKKTASQRPSHFVGIGASAGGLEAIEAFFKNMPPRSNLAFIVVQHLSPDYKSLMVELLSKKTEMPVHRAEDGMEVLADNVYLIPPKKNLTIFHGKLVLNDKGSTQGINLPIDIFLRSLAEDQAERTIAIILSGTGSDGTRGVRAIKELGGMVMVQSEESAKFDGMPRAAISTGVADYVLPPEKMPEQLLAYVAHPYVSGERQSDLLLQDADALTRLFAELRDKTRVDFTHYKPSTITRRIERRMSVNQIGDFENYVEYLQRYPGEVQALYRDLLIGVTSFFRDPEAMQELEEKWLTGLLRRISDREIRFWVAGCSTGEEAYTLAIMAKEAMERHGLSRVIKVFATDIDRDAIMTASSGVYPESIAGDLTPKIVAKYFYHKEEKLQIARHLREMVVFAQHNLIKDPPFTNIDLISCRNLLIYLQPVLQQKVFDMFNFSLNPDGLLFLGSSESIGEMGDCFEALHQKHKIYRSLGKARSMHYDIQVRSREERRRPAPGFDVRGRDRRQAESDAGRIIRQYLQVAGEHYLPPSVIVNERLEIVHFFGDMQGYFRIPAGPAEYNITRMASGEMAIPLATGIQKVFRTGETLSYTNIRLRQNDEERAIRIRIWPMPEARGYEPLAAVFFEQMDRPPVALFDEGVSFNAGEEASQRIRDLEQELQFARENLQATIEELETSNEELQATNEELLASNEELQSTNEELQSTNEELYTV
ncbi:MAG: chemotaxis protein CheR, partial [Desulfobulbaceae bacterium]